MTMWHGQNLRQVSTGAQPLYTYANAVRYAVEVEWPSA